MVFEIPRRILKKKLKMQISRKTVQWEPRCFMLADRLIVAFRDFWKTYLKVAPKTDDPAKLWLNFDKQRLVMYKTI